MIRAVFMTMLLRLWRDKGALFLAFVLPGFIFAIFAAIFSTASGGSLDLRVSLAALSDAPSAQRLSKILQDQDQFTLTYDAAFSKDDIAQRVKLGTDDVGIVIEGDLAAPQGAAVIILTEPSRAIASEVLQGQLRQIIGRQMPDIALRESLMTTQAIIGALTPEQNARAEAALSAIAQTEGATSVPSRAPEGLPEGLPASLPANLSAGLIASQSVLPDDAGKAMADGSIAYYVGGTAILFLLFSAMHGAALSLEERSAGITDRLLLGPRGAMAMMAGKFLFLTLQGLMQAGVILAVAGLFFGVPVLSHIPALIAASLSIAAASAAIALLVSVLAKSSVQMNTLSTFIVLLFSAIGGSMVPRFMMPGWLQSLGVFTPNSWAIELYYGILARGSDASALLPAFAILSVITLACLIAGALLSHRLMRY